jgi:integrase
MQGLVGKCIAMSARRDTRNGHWFFRKQIRFPDGRRERIFGVPTTDGLPDTKAGAQEAERLAIQRVLTNGSAKPPPPPEPKKEIPTLSTFAPLFLEISSVANKPSALASKELVLRRHILPRLGTRRLDEISYEDVEDLKVYLATAMRRSGKTLKAKTVNNIMATLHRLLVIAKKRSVISSLPEFERIRCPSPEFDFLSFEEAPRLIAGARDEWRTLITLALRTGLRRGELLALRWQDVDLQAGKLLVRQNLVRGVIGTPKNGKSREVPLSAATVAMLKSHRHLRGPLVFCDDMGGFLKINKLHRVMEATCKRAGLRHLGWHVLRHTFASHLAMRNVPLKAVQELLGHASIQMTMRYAHLSPNVSRSAVDLLDSPGVAAGGQQSTDNALTA